MWMQKSDDEGKKEQSKGKKKWGLLSLFKSRPFPISAQNSYVHRLSSIAFHRPIGNCTRQYIVAPFHTLRTATILLSAEFRIHIGSVWVVLSEAFLLKSATFAWTWGFF
jgi:hypothetical protein